jgi:hypothetical protein
VRTHLFVLKPVEINLGWFDDVPNHAQSVCGSYLTLPAPTMSRGQADFYYIGLDSKSATYGRGTGHKLPRGRGIAYGLRLDAIPSD